MKNTITKAQELFRSFETDATLQLEKGNKATGARARKAALELSKLMINKSQCAVVLLASIEILSVWK